MLNLGRFQLGDFVSITLQCHGAKRLAIAPSVVPSYTVYKPGTPAVAAQTRSFTPIDAVNVTGLFQDFLFLGSLYSAGYYVVWIKYDVAGVARRKLAGFQVLPNGAAFGHVVSFRAVSKPQDDYLLYLCEDDVVRTARGPVVIV